MAGQSVWQSDRSGGQAIPDAALKDWIAVLAGAIGAFMATLDIAIVNTAMPSIVGELGISVREGSWIATVYLVAEVIAIPLCGWLERVFGIRLFLLLCIAFFTAFSLLCGFADSLPMIIIGRAGQGFFGGALIPTALMIVTRFLPIHQRSLGTAVFGGTVIFGPVVGPLLGGWITDEFGWRNIFLINVPVGVALAAMITIGLPRRRIDWGVLGQTDILGVIGMSLGLGCLTTLLEQGQAEEWFASQLIWQLLIFSTLGFGLLAIGQRHAGSPVVALSILRNRQFAAVFVMSFILGAALYGTAFIIPQFLSLVAGDNALQSGYVVFIAGVPALVMIPLIPLFLRKINVRAGTAIGLAFMGMTCWLDSGLSSASGDDAFVLSQLTRGIGQVMAMTFLNQAAMSAVPVAYSADASSLFNAARNLGGSFGLALLATFHELRTDVHGWAVASGLNDSVSLAQQVEGPADPNLTMVLAQASIGQEALVMAFNDQFLMLAIAIATALPLVAFMSGGGQTTHRLIPKWWR